jgi:WD40 repeat protein
MTHFSIRKFCAGVITLMFVATACAPVTTVPQVVPTTLAVESIAPPIMTLTVAGVSQEGGIGPFCWNAHPREIGSSVNCTDVAGISTAQEPLILTDFPAEAEFRIDPDLVPDSVTLSVQPVTASDELVGQDNQRWWNPGAGWSGSIPAGNPITYSFQEGEFSQGNGSYVIRIQASWQGRGDVAYGFLAQVGSVHQPASTPSVALPTPALVTLQAPQPLARLGKGYAQSITLSKDGRWLAIDTPLGVYVYQAKTQKEAWFMPLPQHWRILAFSPDSKKLAVGAQVGGVLVVDAASGQGLFHIQTAESGQPDWSPDGTKLLTGAGCEEVKVWDANSGTPLGTVQEAKCNYVVPDIVRAVWSGDGSKIYVSSDNGVVTVFDAATYQPLAGYAPHPPEFSFGLEISPSPTHNLFALPNGPSLAIMDGNTGEIVQSLEGNRKDTPLGESAWSPDGNELAAGSGNELIIWDAESGVQIHDFSGFTPISGMSWMPDGRTLVGLLSANGSLNTLDTVTGKVVFSLPGFGAINSYSTTFEWEGDQLLTYDGIQVTRWNARSGAILNQEPVTAQPPWAQTYGHALAPDGKRYASPDTVYTVQNNQAIVSLQEQPDHGRDRVAWSPDGRTLASGDSLNISPIILWNANTGKALMDIPTSDMNLFLGALAFSPDGRVLVGGGSLLDPANGLDEGVLILWNAETGERKHLLTSAMAGERISSLGWSGDGRWLAAGMYSGRILLWDMQTLRPVADLDRHQDSVIGLGWSSDDALLASNSQDGTVLIWKAP